MIDHRIAVIAYCVSRWKKSCLRRALKLRGALVYPQIALILEPDGGSLPGRPAAECEVHRADGSHLLHRIADYLVGDGVGLDCRALTGLPCWYHRALPVVSFHAAELPRWNAGARILRFKGTVVKRFTKPANNQEHVLMAFEEEGWPEHIDDPTPPHGDIDPKRCLHGTIARLNQHQERRLIRFSGDGRGEGIRWEPIDEADAILGKDGAPS